MGENEVNKVIKVIFRDNNTGEQAAELDVSGDICMVNSESVITADDIERSVVSDPETVVMTNCIIGSAASLLVGCGLKEIEGSRVHVDDGELYIEHINKNGDVLHYADILPDIVNVEKPNDKTVFVEFADGTKEVAKLSDGDTFCLETGVLICITKKLLSGIDVYCTGSSLYNHIIKYAMTKLDKKKNDKKEREKRLKEERKKAIQSRKERQAQEKKVRDARIREMAEAYKKALKEYNKEVFSTSFVDGSKLADTLNC